MSFAIKISWTSPFEPLPGFWGLSSRSLETAKPPEMAACCDQVMQLPVTNYDTCIPLYNYIVKEKGQNRGMNAPFKHSTEAEACATPGRRQGGGERIKGQARTSKASGQSRPATSGRELSYKEAKANALVAGPDVYGNAKFAVMLTAPRRHVPALIFMEGAGSVGLHCVHAYFNRHVS